MITKKIFGDYLGKTVTEYTLANDFLSLSILDWGGILRTAVVNTPQGKVDVVLGADTVKQYLDANCYLGAIIGRVGNRIADGKFSLNGKEYRLDCNDGNNHLHGGVDGFSKRIWRASACGDKLTLSLDSPDGDQGYPAALHAEVVYTLKDKGFSIEFFGASDGDTIFSPTTHSYFNLSGEGNGDVLDTILTLNASHFTPARQGLIPTGEIAEVKNTPMDFTQGKAIGKDISTKCEQLDLAGGYDVNVCLDGRHAATAFSPKTQIKMDVFTDAKGMQFYGGNQLKNVEGKHVYNKFEAFCLEPQFFPDAINKENFEKPILKQGHRFTMTVEYVFEVK